MLEGEAVKISHALAAVLLTGSASSLLVAMLGSPAEARTVAVTQLQAVALEETSGKIGTIDGERQLITVEAKGQHTRLQVNQSTTIFVSGRTGTLADLSAGQRIRATFEASDRSLPVAEWIELSEGP